MIDAKYQPILFAFFMALFMSFLMSGAISLINLGWVEGFVVIWMNAWFSAFVIAFPVVIFVGPMVRKIVANLTRAPGV